jgi:hypothetical protein
MVGVYGFHHQEYRLGSNLKPVQALANCASGNSASARPHCLLDMTP